MYDYDDKRFAKKKPIISILKLYKKTFFKLDLLFNKNLIILLALPKHYWYNLISNRF